MMIAAIAVGVPVAEFLSALELETSRDYFQFLLQLVDITAWAVAMFFAWWLARRSLETEEVLALYTYRTHGPD